MREKLRHWLGERVVVPRWMLTLKYALFTVLGVCGAIAGIPTLSLTTWDGYTTFWGAGLAIAAGIAAAASYRARWEPVERWASLCTASLLITYAAGAFILAFGEGHVGRMTFAIGLLIVTLFPSVRAGQLLLKTGIPRG